MFRTFSRLPPLTVSERMIRARAPVPATPGVAATSSSLNTTRSSNAFDPSCSAGTSANDAVSGVTVAGPGIVTDADAESASPSAVHTASASSQSLGAASESVTEPSPEGVTLIL